MAFFDTTLLGIELSIAKRRKTQYERQQMLDDTILQNTKIQEENKDTQKSNLEIAQRNYGLNERLTNLVAENKEKENILLTKENILLAREEKIKSSEDDMEERKKNVRKEEIVLEARKSDIRNQEQEVSKNEKDVKERETEAKKIKSESEEAKEKYQILFDELDGQKENITYLEKEAKRKNDSAKEKEASADAIFERAKTIDDEIKAKEAEFESRREEIESSLKAKIEEYDRKLEDINNVQEFIDNVKFDDSEDGKAAKIVVKEAIRLAKKSLADIKTQFDELDEKYCSGTFKGFSTPISEIDKSFEDLKTQYLQIKEHIEANGALLPESIRTWRDNIEEYINNADKSIKSWEFSEAYRNIILGLSTCKNYELLLTILNEWGSSGTSSEEGGSGHEKEFTDYYEIFELNPDATKADIKKKYKELMKKYHPDKNPNNPDNETAQKINEAYNILSDDEKRKEFDEKRKTYKK